VGAGLFAGKKAYNIESDDIFTNSSRPKRHCRLSNWLAERLQPPPDSDAQNNMGNIKRSRTQTIHFLGYRASAALSIHSSSFQRFYLNGIQEQEIDPDPEPDPEAATNRDRQGHEAHGGYATSAYISRRSAA
jgi:hypothetical protein